MGKFKIYYEDTDASWRVYYANYLKYLERGRTEFLYKLNLKHKYLKDKFNIIFVVKKCETDFKKPTYFEDIICVGYDADKVCRYVKNKYMNKNVRIVENQMFDNSNSCEGVRLCLNNINNDKVIILDGSLLLDQETLYNVNTKQSYIMTEEGFYENLEIGVNIGEHGTIEHFGFGAHTAWSEVLFLHNDDVIESLRRIISSDNFKQKFLFEGLNALIKTKHKLSVISNKYPVKNVNNIKTYHKLRDNIWTF